MRLFHGGGGEPSGFWWAGIPRIGARWKVDGREYVLVDVQVGDGIRLQYQERGSWEAARLIDPHAGCWRKPQFLARIAGRQS